MKIRIDRDEIEEIVAEKLRVDKNKVKIVQKINTFTSDEIYIEVEK